MLHVVTSYFDNVLFVLATTFVDRQILNPMPGKVVTPLDRAPWWFPHSVGSLYPVVEQCL